MKKILKAITLATASIIPVSNISANENKNDDLASQTNLIISRSCNLEELDKLSKKNENQFLYKSAECNDAVREATFNFANSYVVSNMHKRSGDQSKDMANTFAAVSIQTNCQPLEFKKDGARAQIFSLFNNAPTCLNSLEEGSKFIEIEPSKASISVIDSYLKKLHGIKR